MLATWVATVTLLVISSKWVVAKPMEVTKNKSIIGIFSTSSIIYLFFEVMMVTTIVMPIWETMFGVLNMILGKVIE